MKPRLFSIFYDFFTIVLLNLIFLNLVELKILINIFFFNFFLLVFFVIFNFYKKTSAIKIFDKLKIIIASIFLLSVIKFFYFKYNIYFKFVFFQDLLLLFIFITPRIFLNIKEFKINFIKNYNQSRQGTLVIGGLGYIGSGVVLDLLKKQKKVSVLDCCMYGDKVLDKFYQFPNFQFIKGYASDVILLSKLLRENSKVVHLAGLVGDPACAFSEDDTKYFNIKTTNIIKNLCNEFEVQRLIFASSCSVYGKTDKICSESSDTNPVSLYAQTKLDSEKELLENKIDTKILRFSTIFGPAERLRFDLVVNLFIAQAFYEKKITMFGGNQVRPFLHVRDASKSIINFLNYKITNTQDIYNVGCNELNDTISNIAEIIKKNISNTTILNTENNTDLRNYRVSFKKYNNLFPNQNFSTINNAIEEFKKLFEREKINFRENIYNNLMVTEKFIDNKKKELNNLNIF